MKTILVRWEGGQLFIKSEGLTNAEMISLLEMAKGTVMLKTLGPVQQAKQGVLTAPAALLGRKVDQT